MHYRDFEKYIKGVDYYEPFLSATTNEQKIINALDRAWKNRDFEIDKYWSRATYFWAFIASAFGAYCLIASSENIDAITKNFLSFVTICIGLLFSVAWNLVIIGSKKWQENWEKHIDMLEDFYTGPIYKTVLNQKVYSVSKINQIMSEFIISIWVFLTIYQTVAFTNYLSNPILYIIISCFSINMLAFLYKMLKKKDNDDVKSPKGQYSFNRRFVSYNDQGPL